MAIESEFFGSALKAARESKGLSQRALSAKSGVPQAHISKIEKGAVDLRVSSLVVLARILDLELMLVPRKAVSAVRSIVRGSEPAAAQASGVAAKALQRLQKTVADLPAAARVLPEAAELARSLRDLQHFSLTPPQLEALGDAGASFKAYQDLASGAKTKLARSRAGLGELRQALSGIRALRTEAMQARNSARVEPIRPAYTLDDVEDSDA